MWEHFHFNYFIFYILIPTASMRCRDGHARWRNKRPIIAALRKFNYRLVQRPRACIICTFPSRFRFSVCHSICSTHIVACPNFYTIVTRLKLFRRPRVRAAHVNQSRIFHIHQATFKIFMQTINSILKYIICYAVKN